MGIIKRLCTVFSAFTARIRVGGLQGGLKFNLKKSGVDSPRTKQLIAQIASIAWTSPVVSRVFKNVGLTYEDFEVLYQTAVIASPNVLIRNKNLIATFLLIDNPHTIQPDLQSLAQAVSGTTGDQRKAILSAKMNVIVRDGLK